MIAAEHEKTERLRRFNEMTRSLLREELKILDAEERMDYQEALDEEVAQQRLERLGALPSRGGRETRERRARRGRSSERSASRSPLRGGVMARESVGALVRVLSPLRGRAGRAPARMSLPTVTDAQG